MERAAVLNVDTMKGESGWCVVCGLSAGERDNVTIAALELECHN